MINDLEYYIQTLEAFESGKFDKFDISTPQINLEIANRLVSLKCLSGVNTSSMVSPIAFEKVELTGPGKNQLRLWKNELRNKNIKMFLLTNSERVFWLIVGTLIANYFK